MREVLVALGFVFLLLVALALIGWAWFRQLRGLYLLLTGRVPIYKIVRFALIMLVGLAILFPLMLHWERNSPLHLVIKPQAENCVRASTAARDLIGNGLTFGSEWSF
jgi:H+/Cl- antiporter ClcA